ncbi:MAG: GNAT family N-acetyltransferase [Bacteroidetes bacterium]|nr:MAG: GNAT family N-acetyltransferase [Bacteroidota bacterium]
MEVLSYEDLSLDTFHELIALRIAVFVVEQNCPYQELDGKDKLGEHLIMRDRTNGKIIGTARILPPGVSYDEVAIGRVVTDNDYRGKGVGHFLMESCMKHIEKKYGQVPVRISAQEHLENYYRKHGFVPTGKAYLEDDIPHIEMYYSK